jgi:DNA polymerase-3 subunit delta'
VVTAARAEDAPRDNTPLAAGMPWLQGPLQQALHTLQGHALLVSSPPGAGAFELSLAVAQGWLCQAAPAQRPCGQCASCHWVGARSHPDLLCLLPEALQEALGWRLGEAEASEKATKTKPSQDIKVDAVRAAVAFAQTTSSRGQAKVILIHPAERMNLIAANALLKTLEEPAGTARFVLSCTAPQALLPTLRSRCHVLPVALPDTAQAVQWLAQQGVAQPEVLLAATGGLPLAVRDWVAEGVTAATWQALPQAVLKGEAGALAGWTLPRWVDGLQKLCHDAMCVAAGGAPRYFSAAVVPRGAALPALSAWARELQRLAQHADHPWSQPLAVAALLQQARQALGAAK